MSVVVTKVTDKEIVMAADSQITRYQTAEYKEDAKIFQVGEITFGVVGYARDGVLFRIFCETHTPRSAEAEDLLTFFAEFDEWSRKRTNNANIDSSFHIVYQGKAFEVNDYYISEVKTYSAMGSGMDYALGCLYLGESAERAVAAACELNIYCQAPINVFRIPLPKEGEVIYLRRLHGKHYEQVKGSWLAVTIYRLTRRKVGEVSVKTIYKGVKK